MSAEKELLDLIMNSEGITISEAVIVTGHSRTKIALSVSSLLQKNYIIEKDATEFTGGRRSRLYCINGDLGLVAGLDIGATSFDIALADLSRKILDVHSEPANVRIGPIKVLGRTCEVLEKMITDRGLDPINLKGIGIGLPGPVEFSSGTVVSPPIMPGWDRFPVIETVQQWFPAANVVIDNDVNVMALGELTQGVGKGIQNMIFVKLGTGVGAGIICEGSVYRGTNGCAGDIGHINVDKNGPLCQCGNHGCLESLAGGPAISHRANLAAQDGHSPILIKYLEKNQGNLTPEDVANAAREGDAVSVELIRETGLMVGEVLAGLVNFYNPELIVIGGGVSNIGNNLLASIRQAVLNRSLPLATRNLQLVFSELGSRAGILGALDLAMDYIFTLDTSNQVSVSATG